MQGQICNNFIAESGSEQGVMFDNIQVTVVILEEHCVLFPTLTFFGSSVLTSLVDTNWAIKFKNYTSYFFWKQSNNPWVTSLS